MLRDIMSVVKQQAEGYIGNLQKLRRSLSEHASIRAMVPGVLVHRVCGELEAIGRVAQSSNPLPQLMKRALYRGSPASGRCQVCRQSV